jgi:cell division protein FtsI (penicillin-binding protein 3)
MAMAANTLATDGVLLRPFLVREVRDARGRVIERNGPRVVRRVISPETARRVRDYLVSVTQGGGTGTRAAVPGFTVAGKTGTTEKYELEARGYSKTRTVASFVGLIPAEAPELTILVAVEDPRRGRHGSTVSAPVFREVAQRSLPLLGIWPRAGVRRAALAGAKPR